MIIRVVNKASEAENVVLLFNVGGYGVAYNIQQQDYRKVYIVIPLSNGIMATNDIYNSKQQYQTIVRKLLTGVYFNPDKKTKYYIRRKNNLKYFKKLIEEFDYKDISYIRRIQFFKALRKTCACTDKDLKDLDRDDVKSIVKELNGVHKAVNTRRDFINYNKAIWKIILPEKDSQGRAEDAILPYAWRVKVHSDKSLEKDRDDKLTDTEYARIQKALGKDPRMQLYFALMFECLARPQELCYVNLEDIQLFDNYARIRIKEHGKEGTKTLQVIDSYYYLSEWLNKHPRKLEGAKAPLFINTGNNRKSDRLNPMTANWILRETLRRLGIKKHITNYSFKRNGVTARYLAGEPAQNIQKIAGWTSTNQLRTYDLSEQEEFLEEELIKKGIIKAKDRFKKRLVTYKQCAFCNTINPKSNEHCSQCKRPLNRNAILEAEEEKGKELSDLKEEMGRMNKVLMALANERKLEKSGLN